jgi:hypothetical protein
MEINLRTTSFYDYKSELENKFNSHLYPEEQSILNERADPYDLDIQVENNKHLIPPQVDTQLPTIYSKCCKSIGCVTQRNCN